MKKKSIFMFQIVEKATKLLTFKSLLDILKAHRNNFFLIKNLVKALLEHPSHAFSYFACLSLVCLDHVFISFLQFLTCVHLPLTICLNVFLLLICLSLPIKKC